MAIGKILSYNMCVHMLQFIFNRVKYIQVNLKFIQDCMIDTQQLAIKI